MDATEEQKLVHDCEENVYKDVVIKYQRINVEQWSWVMAYTWYATQSEVDGGMADSVGSVIMSDMLLITYCPFCGYRLTEEKKNTW